MRFASNQATFIWSDMFQMICNEWQKSKKKREIGKEETAYSTLHKLDNPNLLDCCEFSYSILFTKKKEGLW